MDIIMPGASSQLLHYNESKLRLQKEQLKQFLLKVGKVKFAVISIGGPYRKGKGFLMNLFIKFLKWLENGKKGEWLNPQEKLNAFSWKPGHSGDTQGIYMWDEPFILKSRGEEIAVLLMDTQGTYDTKKTTKEAAAIFALSTLASSVQIYNLSQQIDEPDLQHLSLFVNTALRADRKKGNNLPKLQFLIRDWAPSEEEGLQYGSSDGQKYLNIVLNANCEEKELQDVRKHLKTAFKEASCFLLPFPGEKVRANNKVDRTIQEMNISPEFIEHLETFFYSLINNLPYKTFNGSAMTATGFYDLLDSYVNLFESGTLPEPISLLTATAKIINRNAIDAAKNLYNQEIEDFEAKNPNVTAEKFAEQHNKSKHSAIRKLEEKQYEEVNKENLQILDAFFKQRFAEKKLEIEKREEEKKREEDLKRLSQLETELKALNENLTERWETFLNVLTIAAKVGIAWYDINADIEKNQMRKNALEILERREFSEESKECARAILARLSCSTLRP